MPNLTYGLEWPNHEPLEIEMALIRAGGYKTINKVKYGMGLTHHYEQMRRLCWPELDSHRWHNLCRDELLRPGGTVTVLAGAGSSGKTHEAAWVFLCEWMCLPNETCVLVSSTDIRGLRMRVWGEMTMLWQRARDRFPDIIPGNLLDHAVAITTDALEDKEVDDRRVRDMRKGIFGIPCKQGSRWVGLSPYVGIKQKRIRLIADEAQFMQGNFLSAFANLRGNGDFRAAVLGNFNDPLDQLGKAAEPKDGWESHLDPVKTSVWDTKFMNGRCVNLIGLDSPNFDFPADQPTRYKYLVSKEKMAEVLSGFPKDSVEYMSQCVGSMKQGILERRVLTPDMCRRYHALEDVIWAGTGRTKIGGLDAAYGGDRCECGHVEFGLNTVGKMTLLFHPPVTVPILVGEQHGLPEEQIAVFCKNYCQEYDIPPENFYHDSTGRGTLGTYFARIWSAQTNPVEFGGPPTPRPVSLDIFIYDERTRQRRLKRCDEHYDRFVTELWFSVRYAAESEQLRGLPESVMEEFAMRIWDKVKGDKYSVETKKDMKERVGRSPDEADWASICVEGARRRGFQISKLASDEEDGPNRAWFKDLKERQEQLRSRQSLTYA